MGLQKKFHNSFFLKKGPFGQHFENRVINEDFLVTRNLLVSYLGGSMFAPVQVVIHRNDTNKPIRMSSEMIRGPQSDDEADYRDLLGKKITIPKGRFYVIKISSY